MSSECQSIIQCSLFTCRNKKNHIVVHMDQFERKPWLICKHCSVWRYNSKTGKTTQQTRDIHPVLVKCWDSVADRGPTLYQHWVNVSCLVGMAKGVFQIFKSEIFNCRFCLFLVHFSEISVNISNEIRQAKSICHYWFFNPLPAGAAYIRVFIFY